jgi:predicted methyltransferase
METMLSRLEQPCSACQGSGIDEDGDEYEDEDELNDDGELRCSICNGAGMQLTADGELFVEFMFRHLRPFLREK